MLKWLLGSKDNRSDYDRGYAWAKESFSKGMSVDEISEKADSLDYNDFDRGAHAACRDLSSQA